MLGLLKQWKRNGNYCLRFRDSTPLIGESNGKQHEMDTGFVQEFKTKILKKCGPGFKDIGYLNRPRNNIGKHRDGEFIS